MRQPAVERHRVACICIFLAGITFLVFGQTARFGFINFDDNLYVYGNPLVMAGLTPQGVARVFTHFECRFYTPLTMLSHMADCQAYALRAGGHHLTSVLLHCASAILLFLVLLPMTGATWRSAFVAAVFAVHPLHVESVAWVAERNDVLCGLFLFLAIGAYVRHTRRPSACRYLVTAAVFALGLMSKPELVTLPLLLLLLDYWPLNRDLPGRRLLLEKVPLLALSFIASVLAYYAEGKSVAPLELYPISSRVSNALVSCVIYIRQMFWPSGLAVFYPRPADGLPDLEIAGALVVFVCITIAALLLRKRFPYLVFGWLWYLIMLAPVLGVVQVGEFAHADRYTYLSQVGLYIAMASWLARRTVCPALPKSPVSA